MIVVLGELGGTDEYGLVEAIKAGAVTKPVVAWVRRGGEGGGLQQREGCQRALGSQTTRPLAVLLKAPRNVPRLTHLPHHPAALPTHFLRNHPPTHTPTHTPTHIHICSLPCDL